MNILEVIADFKYIQMVIFSFQDKNTKNVFQVVFIKGIHEDVQNQALAKLQILHRILSLEELAKIP